MHIAYIGQKGDGLADIPAQDKNIDASYSVRAGKFRRYHGEGWRQLLDIPTVLKNIRDGFYVIAGFYQCVSLLKRLKPDVVFVKGGFVGVPVGLAAAYLNIPFVTHDSDALPGLANRIIARWASLHTVALPKEIYNYPANKTVTVGVPISHEYHPVKKAELKALRERLDLKNYNKVILITGGGLGAQRLNDAVADCAADLLLRYPDLAIVQLAGRKLETDLRQRYKKLLGADAAKRVIVKGFVTNLYDYSAAADVVITRAGGTSMAEFAAQAKACIVVPNPLLTGGHQIKNAQVLEDRRAIKLLPESKLMNDHTALMPVLVDLLDHPKKITELGAQLHKMAQPDAAKRLAMVLLEQAPKHKQ